MNWLALFLLWLVCIHPWVYCVCRAPYEDRLMIQICKQLIHCHNLLVGLTDTRTWFLGDRFGSKAGNKTLSNPESKMQCVEHKEKTWTGFLWLSLSYWWTLISQFWYLILQHLFFQTQTFSNHKTAHWCVYFMWFNLWLLGHPKKMMEGELINIALINLIRQY